MMRMMRRKHRNRERGRQLIAHVPVVTVIITIRGATQDQGFAEETRDKTNNINRSDNWATEQVSVTEIPRTNCHHN